MGVFLELVFAVFQFLSNTGAVIYYCSARERESHSPFDNQLVKMGTATRAHQIF